ncbi:MAG: CARDB domain-containing protein, partial [Thermoplasmatota archaeon]
MLKKISDLTKDESGVSEVLGSILTLSITVILFTSVFASLSYLETPEKSVRIDFEDTFEVALDGDSYWVNLTHEGGHDLRALDTDVYLLADSTSTFTFSLEDLHQDEAIDLTGEDDSRWTIGEKLIIHSDDVDIIKSNELEAIIVDQSSNRIVWRKNLFEPGGPIIIRKAGVEYSSIHPWKDYADQDEVVTLKAEIVSPGINPDDIRVNASVGQDILNRSYFHLDYVGRSKKGYEFEASCMVNEEAESGIYRIKFISETKDKTIKNESAAFTNINIGEIDTSHLTEPDLVVGEIDFIPEGPTDRDRVKVRTNIYNNGGYHTYANVTFFDNHSGLDEREQIGPTIENVSFPTGPAPREVSVSFMINREGIHDITVYVGNERGDDRHILVHSEEFGWEEKDDNEWSDNNNTERLHVKPRILVVNDHVGSDVYDTEHMINALNELDFTYEIYNVGGGINQDGPSEEKLSNFGVTIWMTGEYSLAPLTSNDRSALGSYIDNGGKVWLIGGNLNRIRTSFLTGNFGISSINNNPSSISPVLRSGLLDVNNGNGTYGMNEYRVSSDSEGRRMDGDFESYNQLYKKGDSSQVFGAGYELKGKTRTAANSFLFHEIQSSTMRTTMVDRVIEWLTNMTSRSGVDISVSSQSITPSAPMFKDEVYVNATVRNNGAENMSVPVRMKVNDDYDMKRPVSGETAIEIPARSTKNVTFKWTAEPIGLHRLVVIVDPYDEIDETNEMNNDITYKNLTASRDQIEVNVHFSILVVDDESISNGGPFTSNTTKELITTMEKLNYMEGRDYDVFYTGGREKDHGPSSDIMSNYNAVYWVTGENPNTLTETDVDELIGEEGFLDTPGSNLMMIGENILQNLSEVEYGNGMLEKLGVDPVGIGYDNANPNRIYGQYRDPISHGLRYSTDKKDTIDTFDGTSENGRILFKDQEGNNISSAYDDGRNKIAFFGMGISRINGPIYDGDPDEWPAGPIDTSGIRASEEMIYMISRGFGKIDERPELRVSKLDIDFGSKHPMLTKSYTVKARVENLGFQNTSCLVRFYDGDDYIGSKSPTILPSKRETGSSSNYFITTPGSATLEISWEPSFAGNRTITVQVDPMDEVSEIRGGFRDDFEFNNQAQIEQKVYYFWDDMENGTGNWNHDTNLLSINGEDENEIDYLTGNYDELNTDVV